MKANFTSEQLDQIKQSVEKAESRTSGEIVPLVVSSSDSYGFVHWIWALAGWLGSTAWLLWRAHHEGPGESFGPVSFFWWQCVGVFSALIFSFIPALKRSTIPKPWLEYFVHRQCLANFVGAGLTETRDRTGVLIYISNFERRVQILADSGIHKRVPADYWETQVKQIVEGIRSGNPTDALCRVIAEIGEKLSAAFPRRADDRNELPDGLQVGHRDGAGQSGEGDKK